MVAIIQIDSILRAFGHLDPLGVEHVVGPPDLAPEHGVDAGEDLVADEAPHVELVDVLHLRELLKHLRPQPLHVEARRDRLDGNSKEKNLALALACLKNGYYSRHAFGQFFY